MTLSARFGRAAGRVPAPARNMRTVIRPQCGKPRREESLPWTMSTYATQKRSWPTSRRRRGPSGRCASTGSALPAWPSTCGKGAWVIPRTPHGNGPRASQAAWTRRGAAATWGPSPSSATRAPRARQGLSATGLPRRKTGHAGGTNGSWTTTAPACEARDWRRRPSATTALPRRDSPSTRGAAARGPWRTRPAPTWLASPWRARAWPVAPRRAIGA